MLSGKAVKEFQKKKPGPKSYGQEQVQQSRSGAEERTVRYRLPQQKRQIIVDGEVDVLPPVDDRRGTFYYPVLGENGIRQRNLSAEVASVISRADELEDISFNVDRVPHVYRAIMAGVKLRDLVRDDVERTKAIAGKVWNALNARDVKLSEFTIFRTKCARRWRGLSKCYQLAYGGFDSWTPPLADCMDIMYLKGLERNADPRPYYGELTKCADWFHLQSIYYRLIEPRLAKLLSRIVVYRTDAVADIGPSKRTGTKGPTKRVTQHLDVLLYDTDLANASLWSAETMCIFCWWAYVPILFHEADGLKTFTKGTLPSLWGEYPKEPLTTRSTAGRIFSFVPKEYLRQMRTIFSNIAMGWSTRTSLQLLPDSMYQPHFVLGNIVSDYFKLFLAYFKDTVQAAVDDRKSTVTLAGASFYLARLIMDMPLEEMLYVMSDLDVQRYLYKSDAPGEPFLWQIHLSSTKLLAAMTFNVASS